MAANIKNPIKYFDENTVEQQIKVGVNAVKNTAKSEAEEGVRRAWEQMFGVELKRDKAPESGDLTEGVSVDLSSRKEKPHAQAAINWSAEVNHARERAEQRQKHENSARIEQIRMEIITLSRSSGERTAGNVAVEQAPTEAGVYHVGFFESMLTALSADVHNSAAGDGIVKNKAKIKGFWAKAKAYGTKYSLGSEHQVARNVG